MFSFIKHLWKHGGAESQESEWKKEFGTIHQFTINDIDGNPLDFNTLKGKVLLITNVACDCGYTKDAYVNMVRMKTEFANRPLEIIGFPSNEYHQERRSAEEIKSYLVENFQLNFPLIEKSKVNGENSNPVYNWLKQSFPGDVTWNFSSYFLVNEDGIPIARFEKASWDDIQAAITSAVENAEQETEKAEAEEKTEKTEADEKTEAEEGTVTEKETEEPVTEKVEAEETEKVEAAETDTTEKAETVQEKTEETVKDDAEANPETPVADKEAE